MNLSVAQRLRYRSPADGRYSAAHSGEIKRFTGVSAPCEEPNAPASCIDSKSTPVDKTAQQIVDLLRAQGILWRHELEHVSATWPIKSGVHRVQPEPYPVLLENLGWTQNTTQKIEHLADPFVRAKPVLTSRVSTPSKHPVHSDTVALWEADSR